MNTTFFFITVVSFFFQVDLNVNTNSEMLLFVQIKTPT